MSFNCKCYFVAVARNDDFCMYHSIYQRHLEPLKTGEGESRCLSTGFGYERDGDGPWLALAKIIARLYYYVIYLFKLYPIRECSRMAMRVERGTYSERAERDQ